MCIVPADVTSLKCLFYQKVLEIISSYQYGIECDNSAQLSEIKKLFNHWNFECYSNDFVRDAVLNADLDLCSTRDTWTPGIIE